MAEIQDQSWATKLLELVRPYLNTRVKAIWLVFLVAMSVALVKLASSLNDNRADFDVRLTNVIEREKNLHQRELVFVSQQAHYREQIIIDSIQNKINQEKVTLQQRDLAKDQKISLLESQVNRKLQSELANLGLRKQFQCLIDSLTYSFNDVPRGLHFSSDVPIARQQLMDNVLKQAICIARQLNIERDYAEFFKECGFRYRTHVKNEVDN